MTSGLIHPANPATVARGLGSAVGKRPVGFCAPQQRTQHSEEVTQWSLRGKESTLFRRAFAKTESPRTASAFHQLKPFRRLTTICAWCNKIRDGEGLWHWAETALQAGREAEVSHGMCPECAEKSYNAYRLATASPALRFSTQTA